MNEITSIQHQCNNRGQLKVLKRKTCLSSTLSTTHPTWAGLGSNPDLHGENSAQLPEP